jgi:WD40 repeat protein
MSPDGCTALSTSGDATIELWDVASGRELKTFIVPGGFGSVTFSSDGHFALSGMHDGSMRLWDIATGTERAKMMVFQDGSWLVMTPEGFFDASSPQAAQNFSVVRGLDVASVEQVYKTLHRPDLVREKLAGDLDGKVKAATAELDLDKIFQTAQSGE